MQDLIDKLKNEITELAKDGGFIHREWFVERHLKVAEKIALELCEHYPEADQDLVIVMVWMHDYGKIVDFDNEFAATQDDGEMFMKEIGFDDDIIGRTLAAAESDDNIEDVDSDELEIEDKILITADGCSHFLYGFHEIHWKENSELSIDQLTQRNIIKATMDYNLKIILPEAQEAFEPRFKYHLERNGLLPEKFLKNL